MNGIKYITQYLHSRREKNHNNNMAFVAKKRLNTIQGHTFVCLPQCVGWLGVGIQGRAE